jgi:hypothetical protein
VATKSSEERATIFVTLKSDEVGYLTCHGQSLPALLGTLTPWLNEHGIALGPAAKSRESSSVADELAKLAEIYRSGALTDEEFAAAKAKLLR